MQDPSALADRARDAKDWTRAAALYEAALQGAPLRADLWVQLGHALKESGQVAEAEEPYRRATELAPDDADAQLQLGHALKLLGRRAEAIASYEKALELAPERPDATRELVHLGAASHQDAQFARQDPGAVGEQQVTLGAILQRIDRDIQHIRGQLPELLTKSAFPVGFYQDYRAFNPVQRPPARLSGAPPIAFVIVSHAAECGISAWEHQLRSLQAQTHREFRFFGIGCSQHHRTALERVAAIDDRFVWHETQDRWAAERAIIAQTSCDAVLLMAGGRELHPASLAWFAHALEAHEAVGWICDEEALMPGAGGAPTLLPVFRRLVDRDTLAEANPYGETIALRRSALLHGDAQQAEALTRRRHELLAGLANLGPVGHIPLPLARHRQADAAPTPSLLVFPSATATPAKDGGPIHVVIPTTRLDDALLPLLDSLVSLADAPALLRIHVVENGKDDINLGEAGSLSWNRAELTTHKMAGPFNWSFLNNRAAQSIHDGIVVFANDDMVMLSHGWDVHLRDLLARPDTGAVGAKLTYPDGALQHAGVLLGWRDSTIHDGLDEPQDAPGPALRWQTTRAASAVTGAFLAIRAEIFHRIGGFDEDQLMVDYGDIDLALRLRAQGLRILWSPHIHLTHYESRSRGYAFFRPERQALWDAEHKAMRRRWGRQLARDPSVHPVFLDATRPFRLLRPLTSALIAAYMALTARANPWSIEVEEWPGDDCFPL